MLGNDHLQQNELLVGLFKYINMSGVPSQAGKIGFLEENFGGVYGRDAKGAKNNPKIGAGMKLAGPYLIPPKKSIEGQEDGHDTHYSG